jgi:hypothetical protein
MPNSGASTTAHKTWETDRREREKKPKISIHNIRKIETRKPFYSDRLARESDGFNIPTAHIVSLNKKKMAQKHRKNPTLKLFVVKRSKQKNVSIRSEHFFFLISQKREKTSFALFSVQEERKRKHRQPE